MKAVPEPVARRSRGLILSVEGLQLLRQELMRSWETSALNKTSEANQKGKLRREERAILLDLDVKTADRIFRREPVNVGSLQHAFKKLNLPFHKERYCVSAQKRTGNLPSRLTSFIGREKEMAHIEALLSKSRLLTLTGAGGCGKSRLSLEVAAALSNNFPDGAWLVELAPLSDPALVAQNVADALGLREEGGKPIAQTLQEYLEARHLLLLLDNCEHVLEGCVPLLGALLPHCPHITVLANSREKLGIEGEQSYRVPSLALPPEHGPLPLQSLLEYEAARLFVDRARLVKPPFALTEADATPLVKVCVRLDGIPLALELAAARVRSLSVAQISARLDHRFLLLQGGYRSSLPRHRTLRALIDWSYDLLEDKERVALKRLSVFAGGWSLEAAEQVCRGEGLEAWEVLDLLTSLVDKSLVMDEDQERETRYRLLETLREYGQERLIESGERDAVRGRHRDYFLGLAEKAEQQLKGEGQILWLRRLEAEHDNLRGALEWSLSEGDASGGLTGLRFCGALQRFWIVRGYFSEGREWCARALARAEARFERSSERAKALNAAGGLALYQGDYPTSLAYNQESIEICKEIGDKHGEATALFNLARTPGNQVLDLEEVLALWRTTGDRHGLAAALGHMGVHACGRGDEANGMKWQLEGLSLRREIGDQYGIAVSLNNLAHFDMERADYAMATNRLTECLEIQKKIGDRRGVAGTLLNFGWLACYQNAYDLAPARFAESLTLYESIGVKPGIINCLGGFSRLAIHARQWERAAVLAGVAHTWGAAPSTPFEHEIYNRDTALVRNALDEKVYSAYWAQGSSMSLEQAIEYALKKP